MGVTLHTDGADPLTVEGAVWTMVGGKRRPPAVLRPARVRVLADRAARLTADYRGRADGWAPVPDREGVRRMVGELARFNDWLWDACRKRHGR